MKKNYLFLLGCLFISITAFANNTDYRNNNQTPFIFIENGVEYAVFNNGEFDFNIIQNSRSSININTRNVNLSFNTGYNYDPYILKNRYGAIIRIDRTPIFYNRYGKVSRIGSVNINYNYQGWVSNIGNLNIYYNSYGNIHHRSGYINYINRNYKPYCRTYKRPTKRRISPYYNNNRQNNTRRGYSYSKPYNNNRGYYNNNHTAKNKNQQKKKQELKKQDYRTKEKYRENSNSYRRNASSNNSKYSTNNSKRNQKR